MSTHPTKPAPLYAIFFGSGFASLTLQVVWFKQLGFVLGSSTFAVTVTVASFFLGLSLGSVVGGRFADRSHRPLLHYGFLEAGLGVLALAITLLLSSWSTWLEVIQPWIGLQSPLRLPVIALVAVLILLAPTILMGATLPFIARHLVTSRSHLGSRIGMLYGLNTLGAACGAFTVGFLLIGVFGVFGAALVAAGVYFAVSAAALVLARGATTSTAEGDAGEGDDSGDDAEATLDRSQAALLGVFAASGFAGLGYEIVWFRMLAYGGHQSVFTFSSLLFVYLIGLVLGAIACARWLAHRPDSGLAAFARIQLLLAASATLSLAMMGKVSTFRKLLAPLPSALGIPLEAQAFLGFTFSSLVVFFLVLIVPTTLLGISFPLASELTIRRLGSLGRRLGVLYSLNTLGGVAGSLVTGFVLLPMLGSQGALVVMIVLNLVLFAVVVRSQAELRGDRTLRRSGAAGVVAVAAALVVLGPGYLKEQQTAYVDADVLEVRETKDATFVVLEYENEAGDRAQQLVVNGESYANNAPGGRRYMAMLAHLPMLLHPDPETALVTCIGTGTTVGSLTAWEELETIHAVDIHQTVFDLAPHFVPVNHTFYENPHVEMTAADGRHFLLSTTESFDVLTFEPPPPSDAGVVNLYSEEFYELAKRRTAAGGLMTQWVPFSQPRADMPKLLLRALLAEYEYVSLWMPAMMEGIAIASNEPLVLDEAVLLERLSDPQVAADLAPIGITRPEHVLAMFIADEETLRAYVDDVPRLTDDRPWIEYHNLLPLEAHHPDELTRLRVPVADRMTAPPRDPERLQREQRLIDHMWRYSALRALRKPELAEAERDAIRALAPENEYVRALFGR